MQEAITKKKEIVRALLDRGILVSSDFLESLNKCEDINCLQNLMDGKIKTNDFLLLNKDTTKILTAPHNTEINWHELERAKVLYEKGVNKSIYPKFLEQAVHPAPAEAKKELQEKPEVAERNIKIISSYKTVSRKREVQDFVSFFNKRYEAIQKLLQNRGELQNITSISRLLGRKEKSAISVIGIISEIELTKNGNIIFLIEDQSGQIKVLINKNKPDLFEFAKSCVYDDVIGICGANGENIIFANDLILPDIPMNRELKKASEEVYAIFLSDLHVGSNKFLPEQFDKFLSWIQGKTGSEEQKNMASKVSYAFIAGDLVDGVSIYPGQEEELVIKDIYQQYEECARLLAKIPKHITLVICPGNHDAMRLAEPQPELYKDFAKSIWELPNAIMVSNPAMLNMHSSKDFPGFDVLIYHGYSFDYYIANVDSIRSQGGYDRADLMMKFLLQRRHLAPSHTSTPYLPDANIDPLVIDKVPDFFVTGHIHKTAVANYKNITMICGSCWQAKTSFQEKVGHHPEPARVPVINLQTRQTKILKF